MAEMQATPITSQSENPHTDWTVVTIGVVCTNSIRQTLVVARAQGCATADWRADEARVVTKIATKTQGM